MSTSFATAYVLYNGTSGSYVGDQNIQININCDRMRAYSPRPVWLKRRLMPGDGTQIQYLPTFNATDPEIDSNTLVGFAIEVDGQDTIIDIVTWQALITACNCPDCVDGFGNLVTRLYTYGVPAFTTPTALFYCVTRADDGSLYAHSRVATDYTTSMIGNVQVVSNISGVSIYRIQSYYTISQLLALAVGTDVIAQC
jgi:hypothetical protein